MAALPPMKKADQSLVDLCSNARQALSLCVRLSGLTDEEVAKRVGISKGYLSKILNGRARLCGDKRIRLMRVCGNSAPAQYETKELGFDMTERSKDALIRQLEERIEMLRAAA